MATSTKVATALAFNTVNAASSAADISASVGSTVTAYVLPTANPGKLPFTVVLEVSPDNSYWVNAGSFKVAGNRTDLVHFSATGIRASFARLRQNDPNQGANGLTITAWISA